MPPSSAAVSAEETDSDGTAETGTMTAVPALSPPAAEVVDFLARHHGEPIADLEPLGGGFWSSAWGYRCGDRRLVLRVGANDDGFRSDRSAMAFARPGLPVPAVHEIGPAFGGAFAISDRYDGRFLELVEPDDAQRAGTALFELIDALRSVPASPDDSVIWQVPADSASQVPSWHAWLRAGLADEPRRATSGWRATLAGDARLDALFRRSCDRVEELLAACPERRDLVHGDLLHGNVLVTPDAARVTAVFSWKCSARGDFLYDLAWCTFWAPWHPGIAAIDPWARWCRRPEATAEPDAAVRHHCYELQIGASHLGWYAWTDDAANLRAAADHLEQIVERGPRPVLRVPRAPRRPGARGAVGDRQRSRRPGGVR